MAAPAAIANTNAFPPGNLLPQPSQEVCLGAVEAIPSGQGRAFHVGTETIAVFRQRNGKLYAIQNECPHRGGPLAEGILGAGTVLCPFHAWKIQVETGECLTDPCTLRTYQVREEAGQIYLRLPCHLLSSI